MPTETQHAFHLYVSSPRCGHGGHNACGRVHALARTRVHLAKLLFVFGEFPNLRAGSTWDELELFDHYESLAPRKAGDSHIKIVISPHEDRPDCMLERFNWWWPAAQCGSKPHSMLLRSICVVLQYHRLVPGTWWRHKYRDPMLWLYK